MLQVGIVFVFGEHAHYLNCRNEFNVFACKTIADAQWDVSVHNGIVFNVIYIKS